ncbi:MAG: heparinase II/III family protein [Planctomycetes bacterium]|nr:heparinase II/III family protein [Planctomycetota bacterium]
MRIYCVLIAVVFGVGGFVLAAPKAEKPAPAVALEKLPVPKDHPRILITAKDLPQWRERIKAQPFADHWAQVESLASQFRSQDPKDAYASYRSLQSRCFMTTQGVEAAALHALISEDKAEAEALSTWLVDFDPAPYEKGLTDNDFMPHGEFIEGFALALDWAWPVLSVQAREKLQALVIKHVGINYNGFIGKKSWEATCDANNHSMAAMGAVGLASLALWHEHPDALKWATLARDKAKAYLAQSFDEDGACFEGTMYGPFGLMRILPFAAALTKYGHEDILAKRLDLIIEQLIAEMTPGCAGMLPLNDTDGNFKAWPSTNFLYAATKYRNPRARWAWETVFNGSTPTSGGHTGTMALLWDDEAPVKAEEPTKLVKLCRGRGLLTVRTGWKDGDFLACFEAGKRVNGTHCQADHGSFLIHAHGKFCAADTGYSNDLKEGSPNQTVGHNGVLIDGKGMCLSGGGEFVEAKITQFEEHKDYVLAVADLTPAYNKKNYNTMALAQRAFVCVRGERPYLVIVDSFNKDGKDHEYTWLMHGGADSQFSLHGRSATHAAGGAALEIFPGMLEESAFELDTMTFPSGNFGDHPALRMRRKARTWAAATVLMPHRGDEAPASFKVDRKGGKLALVLDGAVKDTVIVTQAKDGKLAAIRLEIAAGKYDLRIK